MIDGSIYTPLNVHAKEINDLCLEEISGGSRTYLSADSVLDDHKEVIPLEYLNSITMEWQIMIFPKVRILIYYCNLHQYSIDANFRWSQKQP